MYNSPQIDLQKEPVLRCDPVVVKPSPVPTAAWRSPPTKKGCEESSVKRIRDVGEISTRQVKLVPLLGLEDILAA